MEKKMCVMDEEKKQEIEDNMLANDVIHELEFFFSALSDVTRLKILNVLAEKENYQTCSCDNCSCDLCVCDIANILGMSNSAISHQLRVLRTARLVKKEKRGKQVFYSITDNHILEIMNQSIAHLVEEVTI